MATTKARDDTERTRLSKQAVTERALALADASGPEALTIRRLAQDLGVTPMALYWHFRSKEELIAGITDRIWREIRIDVDTAAPWPAQLRGLLESLIGVLRAHPSASQLLLEGEKQSEGARQATEVALEVLHQAGFDPGHASEIARATLYTGLMLVMSEPGYDPALTAEQRADLQRRKLVELASLPPDRYPRLVEAAGPMTACDAPEFHYRFGVDLFVAGVEAMARQQAG